MSPMAANRASESAHTIVAIMVDGDERVEATIEDLVLLEQPSKRAHAAPMPVADTLWNGRSQWPGMKLW